jgi:hypothetical protein
MKKPIVIGLDFHGTVFDHRIAKYLFFKDSLGLDYENHLYERKEIVAVLNQKYGVDEVHYKNQLDIFLKDEQALNGHFVTGFKEFLLDAPKNWEFVILSGTPVGVTNVNRLLHFQNLNRITGAYCTKREQKPQILKQINAQVYFDDRDDLFIEAKQNGIITAQINPPINVKPSAIADFFYTDWYCAADRIDELISSLKTYNSHA